MQPEPGETTISATVQDYLKAIWSATEWGGPAVTTKALAERFGTTPATVSDTIRRLTGQGLVDHEPYRAITLTAAGERHALRMVRRHRLIEAFLVSTLDYAPDEVHDEAEELEHVISELMLERIDLLLGHPTNDPHGDPIPSAEGVVTRPVDAVSLAQAAAGRYRVARVSDADPTRLTWFLERGVTPGGQIDVEDWDEIAQTIRLTVLGAGSSTPLVLARPAAEALMLTPVSSDPG